MTATEIYESVSDGGTSDELDLIRIAETYPGKKTAMPTELNSQVSD
jgi:hypothetical protein